MSMSIERSRMGDLAPTAIHGWIDRTDVTRVRRDLGLHPNGVPAKDSIVSVICSAIYIYIKVKQPHPTKPRKEIWVRQCVLSHRKFTSFGHSCPVVVSNPDRMQDGVVYKAVVKKINDLTSRVPTLTVDVIYE